MDAAEIIQRLDLRADGEHFRVNARESADLEFKLELNLVSFRKSLKTVCAFANQSGGSIVFGIRDRPRRVVGIGQQALDEGIQSEQLIRSIVPCPDTSFFEFEFAGLRMACLHVEKLERPPSIAIRDLLGEGGQDHVLRQGTIYARRRGQTAPISGEEFNQILLGRDERAREEIFRFLANGRSIGFDRAVVADTRGANAEGEGVTFYLPAEAAREMNVIDRARVVEENGAPAYEIRGNVRLTVPGEDDPRQPMRA